MLSSNNKSNSLSFITFISWFNKSISRPSLHEDISNSFSRFSFQRTEQFTYKRFVYIVNFTEIFIFAPFLHVCVCREKGTHAKLKIFAPETQFSIRSSDGMETSVVKKCSLLKLSIIRAGIFYHSLMPDTDQGKAWNKVLEAAQKASPE